MSVMGGSQSSSGPALAWALAPGHCRPGAEGCEDYHRVRPLLRGLGLAAEPDDHRGFLLPAITTALRESGPDVLVSGSADEAMAAMLAEAGRGAGVAPRLTVVDRCDTPLVLNRAWGAANGVSVSAACDDILAFEPQVRFDLVVTHSFLGHFPPRVRSALMSRWFGLLKPGGWLVTVARLRPEGEARAFDPAAADALAAEAARRMVDQPDIGIPPKEAEAVIRRYAAERSTSYPVTSATGLWALLTGAGFHLRCVAPQQVHGRITGIQGPGLPRGGRYVNIVARRPDDTVA